MSEYMKILQLIEDGEISPDEGAELLMNLEQPTEIESSEFDSSDVLSRLDSGEIDAEEALRLLNAPTQNAHTEPEIEFEPVSSSPPSISDEELSKWKQWWMIPMYVGVVIVALSTLWINSAYQNSGYGFWFFFAWLPLLIGILLMAISFRSRTGPWIHVRVKSPTELVAFSIPIPMKLTGWAINTFGHHIPQLENTSVDEILVALEQSAKVGTPFYVHVDEGDGGEKVEVFIG